MVILARAVGLPARIVVGYVGGQYQVETSEYLVSEADAHSWVEVYFGGIGWVPFEPTAARSLIDDQELDLPLPPELERLPVAEIAEVENDFPWTTLILATIGLVVIGIWTWNRSDLARLSSLDSNSLVLVIYTRLYRYSRWMGLGHQPSDTIYEFSQRLIEVFKELSAAEHREKIFIEGIQEISRLTSYAILANYSRDQVEDHLNIRILQLWKQLRSKMRVAIWIYFWRSTARKVNIFREDPEVLEEF
jgi:hypothetical protein